MTDQYWTDDEDNRRWGMYFVNETGPRIGLVKTSKTELVGRSSDDIRPFEPNGDYERVALPDGEESVKIPVENATCEVRGVFVIEENEVKGAWFFDGLDLSKKSTTVSISTGIVANLRQTLEDD